jgi:hypothetical protein
VYLIVQRALEEGAVVEEAEVLPASQNRLVSEVPGVINVPVSHFAPAGQKA